jgi:hypothetical protein
VESNQSKEEFLYVIHDKMDHFKTIIPKLQVKKIGFWSEQLPITFTNMIAHGHGMSKIKPMHLGSFDVGLGTSFKMPSLYETPLHNIQTNIGQTIQISRLDPFYICSVPWRRSLLMNIGFYLNFSHKTYF